MYSAICPECKIGKLIQLVNDNEDVCYCPICENIIHNCVAREVKNESG